MERSEKREFVESLAAIFAETSFVLVARNAGMTVADVSELRRKMRAAGASYKVAKNRLATRALEGTRFQGVAPMLKGPTALAWSADPVAVAKTAVEFAKTNDKFV
ncbi:MAG: 50S ribosomal protein L10, partial [Alphaproteobacteria bacterium]